MTGTASAMVYDRGGQAAEASTSATSFARIEACCSKTIGGSAKLRDIMQQAAIVAPTDATALLLGETGTGKGVMAAVIHALSARRHHAFGKGNGAAIPL